MMQEKKMKHGYVSMMFLLFMLFVHFSLTVSAATVLPGFESVAGAGCTLVGAEGSFLTDTDGALARINEIRYEACTAGNVPDPRDPSRMLTSGDYVPMKWSMNLEKTARIRAAEASFTGHHLRLNTAQTLGYENMLNIFNIQYGDADNCAENLAWNSVSGNAAIVYGINQWYEEKADWVNQNLSKETGHYETLINPDYRYTGMGCFHTEYPNKHGNQNTVSGSYSRQKSGLDETPLSETLNIIQTLTVNNSLLAYTVVLENDPENTNTIYLNEAQKLSADLKILGVSGVLLPSANIAFTSGDTTLAVIDAGSMVTGKKEGTVQIKAVIDGVQASAPMKVEPHHHYVFTGTPDGNGIVVGTCSDCGATITKNVPVSVSLYWGAEKYGSYSSRTPSKCEVNSNLYCWLYGMSGGDAQEQYLNVAYSDPDVISGPAKVVSGDILELSIKNPGIASVTLSHPYNQNLTKIFVFRVGEESSASLSGVEISLSQTSYPYTGTACKPTETVTDHGIKLTRNVDYTVSYADNTKAGTAKVIITGMGLYAGSKEAEFTIDPISFADGKGSLTLTAVTAVYTGKEITPGAIVKYNAKTLGENADYIVTYSDHINCGTATATVEGIGNYTGTLSATFEITPYTLQAAEVKLTETSLTYTGSPLTPAVAVVVDGRVLSEQDDYVISCTDHVLAGNGRVTVTGVGNFTGSVTKNFTIGKASLEQAVLAVAQSTYTYTGSPCEPSVTVTDAGMMLTEGTDYTVTYADQTEAGTASATITGAGNYTGSKSVTYEILPYTLAEGDVTLKSTAYSYTGKPILAEVLATAGGKTLTEGTDYTVSYENHIAYGEATVTVTGCGNFTGTVSKNFTIAAATISDTQITLQETAYTYSGEACEPQVSVSCQGESLIAEQDYTVTYENQIHAGTATAVITGCGNYSGSTRVDYTIARCPMTEKNVQVVCDSYTYTGNAIFPEVIVTANDGTVVSIRDYTMSIPYGDGVHAGTYTCTIFFLADSDYIGTVKFDYRVTPVSLADAAVSLEQTQVVYTGSAQTPEVTVSLDGAILEAQTDYTVSYQDNRNAGSASVIVTGTGNYQGECTAQFTIEKAEKPANTPEAAHITVGNEKKTYGEVLDCLSLPEGWNWQNTDREAVFAKEIPTSVEAVYTAEDAACYKETAVTFTFTRCACEPGVISDDPALGGKEATCTEDGIGYWVCGLCGDLMEKEILPSLGHSYESIVTEATCTEDGFTTYTCQRCKDSYTGDITSAEGHHYESEVIEATCTENGCHRFTCAVCGDSYDEEEVEATGHAYTMTEEKSATCTADGYEEYTCDKCGDSYQVKTAVMLGHTWNQGVVTKAATDTKTGVRTYTCTSCKATKKETIPVRLAKVGNVTYRRMTDNTVAYVKNAAQIAKITIPATVKISGKSYKVTEIAANAFKKNTKLTTLVIGLNVEKIGKSAFYGCKNLKTITIKTTKLTKAKVGAAAFKGIHAKAVMKVPAKCKKAYTEMLKAKGVTLKTQKIK